MASDLLGALRQCHSERELWRIRLSAEDTLGPLDMAMLIAAAPSFPAPVQGWLKKMSLLGGFDKGEPQKFVLHVLAPTVHLYRDPRVSAEHKVLIVGFCGNGHRLLLPISCILQQLPSELCDIVVLRDLPRLQYSRGLPPYADCMPDLVGRISAETAARRYRRRYSYGTCSGGFAALRHGLLSGADRAISVSGGFAWHPRRLLEEADRTLPAFDPLCDCRSERSTEVVCVYGADNAWDREQAVRLSRIFPVTHIAVPHVKTHNPIEMLATHGTLSGFFREIFALDRQ